MVFLTSIDILDTGFLSKTTRTNQLSTANRVNSGNALRLKGVVFEIDSSANLDDSPSPGKYDDLEIPLISVNPDTFRLTLFLNSNNTSTTNPWGINDVAVLSSLRRLPKTAGFKALYYPVSANIRKRDSQMIYQLGSPDTTEPQGDIDITLATTQGDTTGTAGFDLTDVNYISVRFQSCKITQDGDGTKITVELNGVITG
jgi:hypothetical protein